MQKTIRNYPLPNKNTTQYTIFILVFLCSLVISAESFALTLSSGTPKKKVEKTSNVAKGVQILVLGDSLTSPYVLKQEHTYAFSLQTIMRKYGYPVRIISGSEDSPTTTHGYDSLKNLLSINSGIGLVVVALGYNDRLNGVPIQKTENTLNDIFAFLRDEKIPGVLFAVKWPSGRNKEYSKEYIELYSSIADRYGVLFDQNFPYAVATDPKNMHTNGINASRKGTQVLVQKSMPIIMYAVYEILNKRLPTMEKYMAAIKKRPSKAKPASK